MLSKNDILDELRAPDSHALRGRADAARREHCGEGVFLRGIVEFSNCCARSCRYCGLRRENRRLKRYRMSPAEIRQAASTLLRWGLRTVILQSGDDAHYTTAMLCDIIRDIKTDAPGAAITLSIGERPLEDYEAFREAGADRYLLKHETVNATLYDRIHPGQSHAVRMSIIERLRELGYQVGVGFLVGLPGQTAEDLAGEILFLQDFQPDMAGIGPFLPQADTPFADQQAGERETVLRLLALARIASPGTHLPATTALATLDPSEGFAAGLRFGCNVIMVNGTPDSYRASYRLYDKRVCADLESARRAIRLAGRTASLERGDSLRLQPAE
ncbi:MAG TPA: [FeFe] hydrogenase H-cluster radical SAM maturase HydE [Kiritimatiellia bacterium]|nr:[FeFe] hydrogenase H-cluster radical SAM maturase HydE [Kiritimatiellia bacterium]HRZ11080.1 [FeFe] hydrogenase H-cluster radical SAM maturase HydE [Kiritimatiellia bacterium]HSA18653.1 [FeFe] hydrogenase H-cluster radical SAM maturase HydE [Kiritimatiellia bacterium]